MKDKIQKYLNEPKLKRRRCLTKNNAKNVKAK
jgi:hypothetical protein